MIKNIVRFYGVNFSCGFPCIYGSFLSHCCIFHWEWGGRFGKTWLKLFGSQTTCLKMRCSPSVCNEPSSGELAGNFSLPRGAADALGGDSALRWRRSRNVFSQTSWELGVDGHTRGAACRRSVTCLLPEVEGLRGAPCRRSSSALHRPSTAAGVANKP